MKFVDEFKDFISRGNVVDMAVGVVVGGAFKSIHLLPTLSTRVLHTLYLL